MSCSFLHSRWLKSGIIYLPFLLSGCGAFTHHAPEALRDPSVKDSLGEERISASLATPEGQYSLGEVYYQRGSPDDLAKAVELFHQAGLAGEPHALWRYGQMLMTGVGGIPIDKVKGVAWLRMAAASEVVEAQISLGDAYASGEGTPRNLQKARLWYQRATEKNSSVAMVRLAKIYLNMAETQEDYQRALEWLEKAVGQGDTEAKVLAGRLYASGNAGPRDQQRALDLLQSAAKDGDADAIAQIGQLYFANKESVDNQAIGQQLLIQASDQGSGQASFDIAAQYEFGLEEVRQNYVEAAKWYEKSALQGYGYAAYRLAQLYSAGKGVPYDLKQANHWYQVAMDQKILPAKVELAQAALLGTGMPRDLQKAYTLFKEAADKDDPFAQYVLSEFYREGIFVSVSLDQSVYWYYRADNLSGNAKAKYQIGQLLLRGQGFAKDMKKAFQWTLQSAESDYLAAQVALGDWYLDGHMMVGKDYEQARRWYSRAAQQGSALAQYNLGQLYYNGFGVPQDYHKAAEYLMEAAKQGAPHAQYRLADMYFNGLGVKQSNIQAYAWWSLAATDHDEGGNEGMRAVIARMMPAEQAKAIDLANQYRAQYVHPDRF